MIGRLVLPAFIGLSAIGHYLFLAKPHPTQAEILAKYPIMERSAEFDAAVPAFASDWYSNEVVAQGCMFAQAAVRARHVSHVSFELPCRPTRPDIYLAADYRDLIVRLKATVDGRPQAFEVKLQHDPRSTEPEVFRLLSIAAT